MITDGKSERERVLYHHRIATYISLPPNAAELMDAGIRTDIGAVLDSHMTGKRRGVRHDYVVSNQAIVRYVHLGHQKTTTTDAGDAASAGRAAMHRHEFADARALSDFGLSSLATVLQVLGR